MQIYFWHQSRLYIYKMEKKLSTSLQINLKDYLLNNAHIIFLIFLPILSLQCDASSSIQQAKYASCSNDDFYLRKFEKVGIIIHYEKTTMHDDPVADWKMCFNRCRQLNCIIFTVWQIICFKRILISSCFGISRPAIS